MNKLVVDSKSAKRIEELWDWTHDDQECYSVKLKNVDGTIWVGSKMEIYNLLNKTDDELQVIANNHIMYNERKNTKKNCKNVLSE